MVRECAECRLQKEGSGGRSNDVTR